LFPPTPPGHSELSTPITPTSTKLDPIFHSESDKPVQLFKRLRNTNVRQQEF
jgi:hypothetical protein